MHTSKISRTVVLMKSLSLLVWLRPCWPASSAETQPLKCRFSSDDRQIDPYNCHLHEDVHVCSCVCVWICKYIQSHESQKRPTLYYTCYLVNRLKDDVIVTKIQFCGTQSAPSWLRNYSIFFLATPLVVVTTRQLTDLLFACISIKEWQYGWQETSEVSARRLIAHINFLIQIEKDTERKLREKKS